MCITFSWVIFIGCNIFVLISKSCEMHYSFNRSDGAAARVSTSAEKPSCGTYRAPPHQIPKLPPDPPGVYDYVLSRNRRIYFISYIFLGSINIVIEIYKTYTLFTKTSASIVIT